MNTNFKYSGNCRKTQNFRSAVIDSIGKLKKNNHLLGIICPILVISFSAFAQQLTITGIAKNQDGKPITGTKINLKNANVSDTTKTNGTHSLGSNPVSSKPVALKNLKGKPWIDKNMLRFFVEKKGAPVTIVRYSLLGKAIGSVFEGPLEKGAHNFDLSSFKTAAGVYFLSININGKETFLRVLQSGGLISSEGKPVSASAAKKSSAKRRMVMKRKINIGITPCCLNG